MISIKRILFPTDFSDSAERAFAIADSLAQKYDATLHVLHVIVWSSAHLSPAFLYGMSAAEQDQLLANARGHAGEKIAGTVPAERTYPHTVAQVTHISAPEAIVDYVDENKIDLVVMGTHGHGAIKRFFLGSTTDKVVRLAACPVITVHPDADVADYKPRRLLVPVDFSEQSPVLLRHAMHLAEDEGGSLDVIHVVPPQTVPSVYYTMEPLPVPYEEIRLRAEEHLSSLLREIVGDAVPTRSFVTIGDPVTEITERARASGYDLLVVATHGYSGIKRAFLGSVAERVVRSAPCPVLVIKSHGDPILESEDPVA
jgi:nucleotide-binding universal stress UspA family protein